MIKLLKPIGHCYGVVNALNIAKQTVKEYPDKTIYVFGLLVHNEEVRKELDSLGIITLDLKGIDPLARLREFNQDDVVIFTAHGHPDIYESILKERGVTFIDSTCKRVKDCFNIIRKANHVIYIGKKDHPEANAALTMNNNVYFYDINEPFDYSKVKASDPLVINQTTLSFLELKKIHEEIKNNIPNAIMVDEICNATLLRQQALLALNEEVDTIIIVGSKKSSNTMKLYELAVASHPNKQIYLFESVQDCIDKPIKYTNAVIASGTSTPMKTINQIKEYLERNTGYGKR
ncbi:MAG TPA: 4-hydroxy-3-methylbut-2-enyl diphosphate reductase [Erysipelotrichaceae bacterium]|nr:4-hydroxy-3-methylbut-2-enyl diphosphate reductase [Erysipelotrichaceae bacterium]